ncbi:MAG: DNA primase regulatory subunit PriL [Methanocellales archaeon]|nr:DNA primase regulatory subunit PriL [Methanocellales archaeon]
MELRLAYYPFTSKASDYVKRSGKSLESFLSGGEFGKAVIARAKERVIQAMEGEIKKPFSGDVLAEVELFSYPLVRLFISCIGDYYLIRRCALIEAKAAYAQMRFESPEFLEEVGKEFGIHCTILGNELQMHFTDYLRFASRMRDPKWKLANRRLEKSYVLMTKEEFARLLQEAIREKIQASLPMEVPDVVQKSLSSHIEEIRRHLEKRKSEFKMDEFAEIDSECFPPCIRHLLAAVQSGQNIAHSARFALTSFLANIGMSADEIIDIYRVLPDFDEEKTRYQVQHILGSTGTAYTAPSCATMATYGNCIGKEALCEKVSHPLSFYRKKLYYVYRGKEGEKPE